jgi:pimeloyl-ACP methyl ester carboxylesterase
MTAPAASKLYVEERGAGEPMLLVAGLGQGLWAWRWVVEPLARRWRTIAFDARGTGRSPRLTGPCSIRELAEDAAGILDGRRAHVVGLSMGGYVALTLALERPELVRSLVLAGTGAGGPDRVPRPDDVREGFNSALALPYEDFVRSTLHYAFAPGWTERNPGRIEEIVAARLEHPAGFDTIAAHADACYRYYAEGIEVERIAVPALVVHGDEDRIVPVENGRALATRLRAAEYVELAGAGHNLPLEEPEAFVQLVEDFLR